MHEHYYTEQPQTPSQWNEITATLRGERYQFLTDTGVFSRRQVDQGTALLIEVMEIPEQATLLDMGCGYGVIGIVAARLSPSSRVVMVDINRRAVQLAQENIRRHRLANAEVRHGDGFAAVAGLIFDAIYMNPPVRAGKRLIFQLYEAAWEHLVKGGKLWIVIQKKQGAPSTESRLRQLFGSDAVERVAKRKGYTVLCCTKG